MKLLPWCPQIESQGHWKPLTLKTAQPLESSQDPPKQSSTGAGSYQCFFDVKRGNLLLIEEPNTVMLFLLVSSLACKSFFHKRPGRNSSQDRNWGVSTCVRGSIAYTLFQALLVVPQNRDLPDLTCLDRHYLRSTKPMGHAWSNRENRQDALSLVSSLCCLLA